MKKISMVLVLLLLVAITPLYGLYCIDCGRSLPDRARFCPWCGNSAANGASTPTAAMETALQPGNSRRLTTGVSPADYLYVGQFEEVLRRNDLAAVMSEVRDYWRLNDIQVARVTIRLFLRRMVFLRAGLRLVLIDFFTVHLSKTNWMQFVC